MTDWINRMNQRDEITVGDLKEINHALIVKASSIASDFIMKCTNYGSNSFGGRSADLETEVFALTKQILENMVYLRLLPISGMLPNEDFYSQLSYKVSASHAHPPETLQELDSELSGRKLNLYISWINSDEFPLRTKYQDIKTEDIRDFAEAIDRASSELRDYARQLVTERKAKEGHGSPD